MELISGLNSHTSGSGTTYIQTYHLFYCLIFQIAQDFVENILGVHQKYREMIGDTFSGDQAFVGALDKACTAVINHRLPKQQAKAPELVIVFFLNHSSEIRGLRSTKCSSETVQNLLYFMYKKTYVVFFVFHFVQLFIFTL